MTGKKKKLPRGRTMGVFCDVCKKWFPGKKGTLHKCLGHLTMRSEMSEGIVPNPVREKG